MSDALVNGTPVCVLSEEEIYYRTKVAKCRYNFYVENKILYEITSKLHN